MAFLLKLPEDCDDCLPLQNILFFIIFISSQKGDDESYYKGKGWGGDKGSSGKAGWGTEYAAEKGKGWGDYYKGGYGYADDWKQYEPAEDDDENPEYRRRILHKDA